MSICDFEKLKPRYCIGGVDLSATTDLTCATIVFKVPNDEHTFVKQMYWLPDELLDLRVQEDRIPYSFGVLVLWTLTGFEVWCRGFVW